MANYNQLKASISAVIKSNNRNEITGQILQNVLNQMVGVIGENYQLAGFATPLTNPGAPDQNVFYVADQGGAYVNFDNIVLDAGLSFLMWKNSQWTSHTVNIVTAEWVEQNYVSIDFFRSLFRAYDVNGDEILPNNPADPITEEQTVVDSIKAMVGFWTEQYISALGHGTGGGGGGGGGATVLDDLLDVTITNPLAGQGLIYNGTKWVNQAIPSGTDMSTVWAALGANTAEQINISHLATALTDYATQSWVNQNFITIAYFDRLFRAYNGSTLVSHNDTISTIDNIKAMFGFWTDFYVSALGTGGMQSPIGLASLNDVALTSAISDGQVLQYNLSTGKWTNATLSLTTTLGGLTDVLLTTPTDNQTILYNSVSGKWYNSDLKTINGQSIIGSGDISVGGGATGNYLPLAGGTMTGASPISFTANKIALEFRPSHSSYNSRVEYMTSGNEALVFSSQNSVTSYIFKCGLSISNTSDWTGITPSLQIKGQSVYINRLIANNETPSYNLFVNGNFRAGSVVIEYGNAINSIVSGNNLWINDNTGNVFMCSGGGKVGIGYSSSSAVEYILDVNGSLRAEKLVIERSNEINSYDSSDSSSSNVHINYRRAGRVTLCYGGGNCGIGVNTPSYKLHVSGTIYATGTVTALSDARHKDVLCDAKIGVEQIACAPAVQFLWKGERKSEGLQVGSIAQYWQTVLPEVVMDKGGELSMQYGVAALVSAIITARKVVDHERRIAELERENERLKTEIEQLRLN